MAIPKETIELVRERAPIEEIIKRYIPSLEKKGNNYIALCPFHKEKTPSFSVSPDKQIFYCFGCHAGGNVFTFISKVEGLTFPESVKFVGDIVGVNVEDNSGPGAGPKDNIITKLLEINRIAQELYHKTLFTGTGRPGLDYITKRGVTEESIKEFKLGFTPDSWTYLTNYLSKKNIPAGLSFKAGLLGSRDKQKYYDKFRNRVIFPIINHKNEAVGFGGRSVDGSEPKYLNSPESVIYKKREVLYGLNIAKPHISDYKRAIVVEGYLDVIGCHQAGIKNAVAPLGTALTLEQVKLLSRYCEEIILLFDADSAGIKASLRAINIFKEVNTTVKIAVLPEFDPFEFIIKKGSRELMIIIDKALDPVDYQINKAIETQARTKDRVKVLLDVFKIISNIEYETERLDYLKKTSGILKIPENTIRTDFNNYLKKRNKPGEKKKTDVQSSREDFLIKSYRELTVLLCYFPELIEQAIMDFADDEFPDSVSKNIYDKLIELYSCSEDISITRIYDCFQDGDEKSFLEANYCSIEDSKAAHNDYTKRYLRIKVEHIDRKINYYKRLISDPGNATEKDRNDYLREYQILQREKDKLSLHL
ncbi:MAG: DNA primase [Spirochaetes bacterium]|nr:DNA primase [Spirochaetota bacterium]